MTTVLSADGLTKYYGKQRGIVRLDLQVRAGEVFGYLGPNGAGKTTTIRLFLDLIRPTSGRATVLGLDSRQASEEVRSRVGYLPGELALYGHLTGEETLRFFANLRHGVDRAYLSGLVERLDCVLDRRVADLSSGNKRKLGLVQAFMHRPEVLVLDEPTSGLDPLVQHEFQHLVAEARDDGQTVFLSSHVLPEVQRMCDRVGFIRDGELVAVEDVEQLTGRAVREVDIVFARPVGVEAFAGLPGVREVTANGGGLRVTVAGSFDALVKKAAQFEVVTLTSREPSLDEVFLALYGEGDHDAA